MKIIITSRIIFTAFVFSSVPAYAHDTLEAFLDGRACYVTFNNKAPGCMGTLQRTVTYQLRYLDLVNMHRVFGKICDKHEYGAHEYKAPDNNSTDKVTISLWGKDFTANKRGKVSSVEYGKNIGTLDCGN